MSWVIFIAFLGFIAFLVWVMLSEARQPLRTIPVSSVEAMYERGWSFDATDSSVMWDTKGRAWVIWDDDDE